MIYVGGKEEIPQLRQFSSYGLSYLTYPALEETGVVKHLFTTRKGGVSRGYRGTMNLNVNNGDDPQAVLENYRRIGEVLGVEITQMVLSHQTHTDNIRVVTQADAGKGLVRDRDYSDVDGLITDVPGLALVTSYADCVPLYFVDPVERVVGLAHSGWKGTVLQIGCKMVERMEQDFGCKPENLVTAIGPSICQDCYEVSSDVAEAFIQMERDGGMDWKRASEELYENGYRGGYKQQGIHMVMPGRASEKYQLDLWAANALILHLAGVSWNHISIPTLCTCHNGEELFSHRASKGLRGNLSAFLLLKEGPVQIQ